MSNPWLAIPEADYVGHMSSPTVNQRPVLSRLGERFPNPDFELDIRCADLADVVLEPGEFDLVHAGLVLEYVEWPLLLPRVAASLTSGGVLSVVLQLPSAA